MKETRGLLGLDKTNDAKFRTPCSAGMKDLRL